jgi:hypothetical protein
MKMFLEAIRKEVYHPRGKNVLGEDRLIRAPFDLVRMRDSEGTTPAYDWYVMPSSGSTDTNPQDAMVANEPAASREMFPYVADRMVMDENAFGVNEDTIQALHFFGQI